MLPAVLIHNIPTRTEESDILRFHSKFRLMPCMLLQECFPCTILRRCHNSILFCNMMLIRTQLVLTEILKHTALLEHSGSKRLKLFFHSSSLFQQQKQDSH